MLKHSWPRSACYHRSWPLLYRDYSLAFHIRRLLPAHALLFRCNRVCNACRYVVGRLRFDLVLFSCFIVSWRLDFVRFLSVFLIVCLCVCSRAQCVAVPSLLFFSNKLTNVTCCLSPTSPRRLCFASIQAQGTDRLWSSLVACKGFDILQYEGRQTVASIIRVNASVSPATNVFLPPL